MTLPDVNNLTWKSPSWSHDTITSILLPGGGVMWRDEDTGEWHLDPAGSVPERIRNHDVDLPKMQ